jgi:hypothetical protein
MNERQLFGVLVRAIGLVITLWAIPVLLMTMSAGHFASYVSGLVPLVIGLILLLKGNWIIFLAYGN